jgi:hypothetical protein
VLALQPHAQHVGVLGADRHDQRQAHGHAGGKGGECECHVLVPAVRCFLMACSVPSTHFELKENKDKSNHSIKN